MATANKSGNLYLKLVPIMLSFFAMSFVDLVGTGTNFIKKDFGLSDTMAGLFPLMVFLWFLIFSVPTGLLMNRIGRRKTVLISLVVTALALLLPVLTIPMPHNTASFTIMLVSFCLLGIGNAIMQVSLNPLLSNIVHGDRLASALTLGQFVKAIGSFVAPIIAGWAALEFGNWKLLYPIFTGISILAVLSLGVTKIEEEDEKGEASTFRQCLALLGQRIRAARLFGNRLPRGYRRRHEPDGSEDIAGASGHRHRAGRLRDEHLCFCSVRSGASPAHSCWLVSRPGRSFWSAC